jgi:hypothetical protein
VPGGVVAQLCGGQRFASAALVEQHDSVHSRVEVDGAVAGGLAAGATVKVNYYLV